MDSVKIVDKKSRAPKTNAKRESLLRKQKIVKSNADCATFDLFTNSDKWNWIVHFNILPDRS